MSTCKTHRDIAGAPWEEVAVDLIGPWAASTPHGDTEFFVLPCIDTTTTLVKPTRIYETSSNHNDACFERIWYSW